MNGWVYFNEDSGPDWSENHPIRSGECPDATDIRRCTKHERPWIDELRKRTDELRNEADARQTAEAKLAALQALVNEQPFANSCLTVWQIRAAIAAADGKS